MFLECHVDCTLGASRLCVEQHPSKEAEQAPVQGFDKGKVTIISDELVVLARRKRS